MAFARPTLAALLALGPTTDAAQQEPAVIPVSRAERLAPAGGGFEFGVLSSVALIATRGLFHGVVYARRPAMRRSFWVRLGIVAIGIVVMRLSIATIARAQTTGEETPPVAPIRVELGFATGVTLMVPEVAGLASVPLGPTSAIEVVVARMPAYWDAPPRSLVQLQFRLPFRPDLRSRKSLLLGVTRIRAIESDEGFLGSGSTTFVRPHAGVSLQWPVASTLDFRFDAQGLLVFAEELPILPRGMATLVWHPRARR